MATAKPTGVGRWDRARSGLERRAAQRQAILASAAAIFSEQGFARASVEAIVKHAGISRRTFYEHFASLRDALVELHDAAANMAYHVVKEAVQAQPDPRRSLEAGVTAFVSLIARHGDLARVVFREIRAAGPEHAVRREALLGRFAGLLFEGVARAYAAKVASRPPDELTVYALVAALESVGMRYLERRDEARAAEAIGPLVELIMRAFR